MHNDLHEEAIVFYLEMLRMGFLENEFLFASVVPAFSGLSSLQHGRLIHGRIEKSAYGVDLAIGNAMVDMYFKYGSTDDGKRVFMGIQAASLDGIYTCLMSPSMRKIVTEISVL